MLEITAHLYYNRYMARPIFGAAHKKRIKAGTYGTEGS